MSIPAAFPEQFDQYVTDARRLQEVDQPEKQLQLRWMGFLAEGFGVAIRDFTVEQRVYMAALERRGFVDVLFGEVVFEFKRRVARDAERYRTQLRNYLISLDKPYTGLLTDGLAFEAYALVGDDLRLIDSFALDKLDAEAAYARLDAYLFSQHNAAPTAADVVNRFGSSSPMFNTALRALERLLDRARDQKMLTVWREQWRKLLSKVYGSDIGSDDLFLRHTYLCQFARILAYAALEGTPQTNAEVERVITGEAFRGRGVDNIGERDFFSWILIPAIKADALTLFRRLAEGLVVYDLSRIDQDLLKQLYQNLVDPQTRHDLGEYYTPDWLAELVLNDISYRPGQSLLDPSCGSGSFLFSAIKRLAAQGLTGWQLVEFVTENVMGMDVHPLAVTVARINALLALTEHLNAGRERVKTVSLPVYMADALISPVGNRKADALVVSVSKDERFYIPREAAARPNALTDVITSMDRFARQAVKPERAPEPNVASFAEVVMGAFGGAVTPEAANYWRGNLKLLADLIHQDRNGIWSYILKNLSRPLVFAEKKFDVIAGNPPWLSYRYIKSKDYQAEVKSLYQYHGLIEKDDVKQFSNMDLSTLFFAHARDQYLKPEGTIAFVMPRAVITGAKQHRPFQAKGVTRVIDLRYVEPLFNVETCVYIREGDQRAKGEIPAVSYAGKLKAHELSWGDAQPYLTHSQTTLRFVDSEVRSPHYYDLFRKGADLIPRNLCFVKPERNASSPAVVTDPDADKEAKAPYKGIKLYGSVDDEYIYATLLSKHLVPFGYESMRLISVPVQNQPDGTLKMVYEQDDFYKKAHFDSADWFAAVEAKWAELKKGTTTQKFYEYLNYRNKLVEQKPNKGIRVLYNTNGTHISACVLNVENQQFSVYGRRTAGFIADFKTYYYLTDQPDEAHFLCALLNAPCVDDAIKAYQTRGIYKGERDITRTPFEACAIPPFDPANPDHCELARLSQQAHAQIDMLKVGGGLKGSVYKIRDQARAAAAKEIAAIDEIARRVLGL